MFYTNNAKEEVDIDEDIIDAENYMNDDIAEDNNLATDQENADIEPQNHKKNTENSLKELFTNAYKNNKLIQAIIDTKVKDIRKLPHKILK